MLYTRGNEVMGRCINGIWEGEEMGKCKNWEWGIVEMLRWGYG
jgi:hypothetical protein